MNQFEMVAIIVVAVMVASVLRAKYGRGRGTGPSAEDQAEKLRLRDEVARSAPARAVPHSRTLEQRACRATPAINPPRRGARIPASTPSLQRTPSHASFLHSSGVSAGPWSTEPSIPKRAPWQGQSQLFSALFQWTWPPRWVHTGESA